MVGIVLWSSLDGKYGKYVLDWQDNVQDRSRFYWLGRILVMDWRFLGFNY